MYVYYQIQEKEKNNLKDQLLISILIKEMSGRKKKTKEPKQTDSPAPAPAPVQRQRRRGGGGNSDALRASLTLIVEMLKIDDDSYNEATLRHNVNIAVRRLEKIVEKIG